MIAGGLILDPVIEGFDFGFGFKIFGMELFFNVI